MDDQNAGAERPAENLISRPPTEADLIALCRELNQRGAKYVVVGGLAIIAAGLPRMTTDVDLMVAVDLENEAKVFSALATLPDNAVRELQPGELQIYNIIRVGDEILVDLLRSAGGIDYDEAAKHVVVRELGGVPIPFASPRLLWRMKAVTHREKDAGDLVFLRQWFAERGEEPPRV
ncbi:MAG TPA: nucleotidyltransferase [Candidatus Limnocylindrales bacterium]|nr:nucleotidyltransferase [Candidatus Limnocylindrales bacterium]